MLFLFGCNTKETVKQADLVEIDTKTFESLLDKKEELNVYVGRPTCPDCKKFKPILEENVPEGKKVFYYNTDNRRNERGYEDIVKNFNVNSVPVILKIKNKKLLSKLDFTDKAKDINNFLKNKNLTYYNDNKDIVKGTEKVNTKDLLNYIDGNREVVNDGFLYFSGIDCSSCKSFDIELESLLNESHSKKVYYFDFPETKSKDLDRILGYFDIKFVPIMFKVENGFITERIVDKKKLKDFIY